MVRRRGGPKVAFNRLRAPGEGDVRDRIEAVYAAVDGLSADDLNIAPVPVFDLDDRAARIADLELRAVEAGRGALLDDARDRLKNALLKRWTSRLTMAYGMQTIQTGRVEDQAAIVTALRDLVGAAVMRDLLPDDDVLALAEPGLRIVGARDFEELDAMTAVEDGDDEGEGDEDAGDAVLDPDDDDAYDGDDPLGLGGGGSLGAGTGRVDPAPAPERIVRAGDARPGAPTAEDWAAADEAAASGARGFRPDPIAIVFGAMAVVGLFAVLSMRVERGSVVSGLVLVGALLLAVFVVFRLWSLRRR